MVRVLISIVIGLIAINGPAYAETPDRYEFHAGMDVSYIDVDGVTPWTEGSVGKLRYDESGLTISRAYLDYALQVSDTVNARIAMEYYGDDIGAPLDFTQAFLEWRPLPRSENRYRMKFGAFYPAISLENTEPGWSSPYTMNSSAINTWVAEELRVFGTELSVSRRPQSLGGAHTFSLQGAIYWNNDPAGSLLAWKGWSVHDRQTRFGDRLPLPPLPQIQPGMMFEQQDPYVEPFTEVDGRAGFYINAEWRYSSRLLVRAMHYDNRADPTTIKGGQYAWRTAFDHIGAQFRLPGDVGAIVQWMRGSTVMGPVIDVAHAVDVEYDSAYVLLTKALGQHRVSARYDHFEVSQNDRTPEDNNPEYGHAWTLSYQYRYSDNLQLAAEWLSIRTHHCGWIYYGIGPDATEEQLQLSLKLRFGN